MIVMQYLRDLGWLKVISNKFAPFTKFLGMRENTTFTLVTGLTIGLAFGAGVMIQAVEEDDVSKKDMILALIFLVTCHAVVEEDRKSTRLNSSHVAISYAVFCLKKK